MPDPIEVEREHAELPEAESIEVEREHVESLPTASDAEAKPVHIITPEELEARKVMVRGLCRIASPGMVMLAEVLTKGRVNKEAALNETEIDLLAEAWAPVMPTFSPWYVAILTTVGVLGNKAASVYSLSKERQRGKDETGESGEVSAGPPSGHSDKGRDGSAQDSAGDGAALPSSSS